MSVIAAFPNWKKGATAAERLDELAGLAREHPERFERFVLCYKEVLPNGCFKYRTLEYNTDLESAVGMYEIAKQAYLETVA